jgi:hypothetical protein
MMTQELIQDTATSKTYFNVDTNKKSVDIATGVGIALLCSHLPFIVSFAMARVNGLTASNYPAVEPTAAAAGLAICLLSLPIALEMKGRSIQAIGISSAVIFWILGLLASFTV